jgi:hypothetical protein
MSAQHKLCPHGGAKQTDRTFGRPDETAAYQCSMALHQRAIVARNTALLSPICSGVYPSPPTPQCAGAALIEGGNPQAPQSPGGFALTFAGLALGRRLTEPPRDRTLAARSAKFSIHSTSCVERRQSKPRHAQKLTGRIQQKPGAGVCGQLFLG